jgi:hypothetical protein
MQYSFDHQTVLDAAEKAAMSLGYTEVDIIGAFIRIDNYSDSAHVTVYCHDDFQRRWDSNAVQCGAINFPMHPSGRVTTTGLMNREQRELACLARAAGRTLELSRHLQSAAGRRFVEELLESTKSLALMLPAPERNALAQRLDMQF